MTERRTERRDAGDAINLFTLFQRHSDATPCRPYLIDRRSRAYTWREALDYVEAIARSLQQVLPGKGRTVSILAENSAEWVLAELGIMRSGHISAPVFTTMTPERFRHALESTNAEVLFVGNSPNWEAVRDVVPAGVTMITLPACPQVDRAMAFPEFLGLGKGRETPPLPTLDAPCMLTFTSGVTGHPKAVAHSLETLYHVGKTFAGFTRQQDLPESRLICYLPLSHIAERAGTVVQSLLLGASIAFNHNPDAFLEDLRTIRPTMLIGVPRIWQRLLQVVITEFGPTAEELTAKLAEDNGHALSARIKSFLGLDQATWLLSSSAITPRATKAFFHRFGLEITDLYGQTEVLPLTGSHRPNCPAGSVGSAAEGYEIKISDTGEILGRGPGMALGYYKDPERTAATFRDGWVHTGDVGYLDKDGFLYIVGRVHDTFKTAKGKYVAPGPIESRFSRIEIVEQQSLCGLGLTQPVMLCALGSTAAGLDNFEVEERLKAEIAAINEGLEPHEKIGAVVLGRQPWTIEGGMLTHTHKTIRERVVEAYAPQIEVAEQRLGAGERNFVIWA